MAIDLNLTPPPSPVNEIQPANVQNQELQEDQDDADAGDQNQLAPPSPLHNQNQEVHEHQNHAAADGDLNQMEPPSPVDEIQPENAENQDQEVEEHVNQNPQPLQQLQLDLNRTPPPSPVDANVENHNQANAGDQHPQQNQGLAAAVDFRPTDVELMNYLYDKITQGQEFLHQYQGRIFEADFYSSTPADLLAQYGNNEVAYMFSPRHRSNKSSPARSRARRFVISPNGDRLGQWDKNGITRPIGDATRNRYANVFINNQGVKTHYMVKEFVITNLGLGQGDVLNTWVLCKLCMSTKACHSGSKRCNWISEYLGNTEVFCTAIACSLELFIRSI